MNEKRPESGVPASKAVEDPRRRLLLHVCCAPCATVPHRRLQAEGWDVTFFFWNPNIHPESEHDLRLAEARRYAEETGVDFLAETPGAGVFEAAAKGLEDEPEGGRRCEACFALRLEATAKRAAAEGFDGFASTLSLSPHKKPALIDAAGEAAAKRFGAIYLPSDWKKKAGFAESARISREHGLHRQDWCGCLYSLRDRRAR